MGGGSPTRPGRPKVGRFCADAGDSPAGFLVAPPSRRLSWGVSPAQGRIPSDQPARRRRYRFKGEEKLQFEVNGQDYFLNFAEDEAYWYVLVPSLTGVQRIPVYVDSPSYERFGILGKNSRNIQN
jgi:hypothetical protein